jgi:hypothetical protein
LLRFYVGRFNSTYEWKKEPNRKKSNNPEGVTLFNNPICAKQSQEHKPLGQAQRADILIAQLQEIKQPRRGDIIQQPHLRKTITGTQAPGTNPKG